MSDNKDQEQVDPAGSTMMFRRFVAENREPETQPKPPITPYILAGVGAIVAIGIIVAVVMTWS
ncbi:hypothetical protein ACFPZ0_24705 [Streptomonospora nanhaiensis]|uniref:Uncharacterized protein n=1 Tax=Streptomonospora nanhaiensis TaxID=1323731 RepID=A0A853BM18_9ACTN|nr:hypothetical protein [Streptomonospora nanhaiensis]MBV2363356.1 hypothetical protein [Streptomonospora nanhaiensis]MBX9388504.1 hypothetical protein [Streptomonospora nanhaiensis]NYI95717.1 hypothetical protein [Streptomonospora nanhaiensis]